MSNQPEAVPTKHRWILGIRGGVFEPGQERILECSPTETDFLPQKLIVPTDVSQDLSLISVTICGEEQFPPPPDGVGISLAVFIERFGSLPVINDFKWKVCPRHQPIALRVRNTGKQTVEIKNLQLIGEGREHQ